MKNNFDMDCLQELSIDELKSLLKSNVISWNIRRRIRIKLNNMVMNVTIRELIPVIAAMGVAFTVSNEVKRIVMMELEKEYENKKRIDATA